MSTLDQQVKQRIAEQADTQFILTVADYAKELGVEIVLSSANYQAIKDFVTNFDLGNKDIFAYIKARIEKLQKAALVYARFAGNPFAFLGGEIFGGGINPEDLETMLSLKDMADFDIVLFEAMTGKNAQVRLALDAAKNCKYDSLEQMLRDEGVEVDLFGSDSRELKWISAVEEAVDYINTRPLAELFEPNVDPMLAKYYVSYPGTDERHIIDATVAALFRREVEALKELLKPSGYTISRLPQSKKPADGK